MSSESFEGQIYPNTRFYSVLLLFLYISLGGGLCDVKDIKEKDVQMFWEQDIKFKNEYDVSIIMMISESRASKPFVTVSHKSTRGQGFLTGNT